LFNGSVKELFEKHPETFENIVEDFTKNFDSYFFKAEFERNFFWNLSFQGLFYCPIERKSFLQTQLLVNSLMMEYSEDIQHTLVFHDEFYISSSISHEQAAPIYSYLIGCGESVRENRKPKVFTYKEAGKTFRIN
jgi:hypothetical protein